MAALIKLGARPKSFTQTVTIPMHEGDEGSIKVSFIYRTRTEYGDFVDAIVKDAGLRVNVDAEEDLSGLMRRAMEAARDKNADYIMRIVDGWNLETEFSRPAVLQLCNELPGAALAIMDRYTAAITEGRLGN